MTSFLRVARARRQHAKKIERQASKGEKAQKIAAQREKVNEAAAAMAPKDAE